MQRAVTAIELNKAMQCRGPIEVLLIEDEVKWSEDRYYQSCRRYGVLQGSDKSLLLGPPDVYLHETRPASWTFSLD